MDGIIPMVYKSLKKSKTRRRYECLSSGAEQTYNIADFYTKDDQHLISRSREEPLTFSAPEKDPSLGGARHRRSNSVHVMDRSGARAGGTFGIMEDIGEAPPKPKQLVRFRSHRMFSCVTGAA